MLLLLRFLRNPLSIVVESEIDTYRSLVERLATLVVVLVLLVTVRGVAARCWCC